MALFGKKTNPTKTTPTEEPTHEEDFSPEALAALAASLDSEDGSSSSGTTQVRKTATFKNGSALGLNIGADTIKAVELTVKNGSCSITGLGIIPTPPDSIANGVVMSVNVLGEAVKELIAQNNFKSRKVVTSVAGTGEVIVRVIEVPSMTDAELNENMKTDLDRYIPFPPNEVQWAAAAMRDIPMDPGTANMDVLLVAARHELIDLHLELLEAAKLRPQVIDVEPLAATRALTGPLDAANNGHIDYNDVRAVLDIGANATEISIIRGDELVFTRTVPIAGNMMTQTLMDQLNLSRVDAERLKKEKGDALPDQSAASPTAPVAAAQVAEDNAETAESSGSTIDLSDASAQDTVTVPKDDASAPEKASADPFDLDLFNQGPTQNEPGEQHQQKMPDSAADDNGENSNLPSKGTPGSSAPNMDQDDAALPSKQNTPEAGAPPSKDAIAAFFDFDNDELDEHSEQLPTIEGQPQHTEAPPREEDAQAASNDDDSFLPSIGEVSSDSGAVASAFAFPGDDAAPETSTPASIETPSPATPPVSDFSLEDTSFGISSEPVAPAEAESTFPPATEATSAPEDDEIDLSDILGETSSQTAAPEIDEGLGITSEPDLGETDFGAGLEVTEKPIDEHSVSSLLKPVLDDLSSELRRSLEYHSARYPDAPVTRIEIIGGGAKMHHLDAYFSQNLGLPAKVGNPFQHLTVDGSEVMTQTAKEHGSTLAIALGLAIRELIR